MKKKTARRVIQAKNQQANAPEDENRNLRSLVRILGRELKVLQGRVDYLENRARGISR